MSCLSIIIKIHSPKILRTYKYKIKSINKYEFTKNQKIKIQYSP